MSRAVPPGALLTFDCYGTLIDWESGILAALRAAYPDAAKLEGERLLEGFHAAQNELKTSEYRSYRDLLTEVATRLAQTHGWDPSAELAGSVPASIPTWTPFPDTNAALAALVEGGLELGILSNIDNDLLAGTLEHFTVTFDRLGTAEDLRSYKPAAPHFELGRRWAAEHPAWLHVAQSLFHDVVPATEHEIRCVWVNRKGEPRPDDARPIHIAPNLASAANWIV